MKRSDVAREAALRAARSDLLAFTCLTEPSYQPAWFHVLLARRLQEWAATPGARLILAMPPRRGKSELASRRLPAWLLGKRPDARVISCSYASPLAVDMSRDVQRIVASELYQQVFPGTRLNSRNVVADTRAGAEAKRTADQWEIVGRTGSYLGRGRGQGITGKGFDYGIIDDPIKDDEEARSGRIRESLWQWYVKAFRTRAAPGARILLIQTRWHDDDLVGRLLADQRQDASAEPWDVLELREIREDEFLPDDPRHPGEVLWPERYPLDEALSYQATAPGAFAALYQQRPSPEGGAHVKIEWLRRHRQAPLVASGDWLQSWDLRHGGLALRSDWAVGQVWLRPRGQQVCYLVDQVRGRWDLPETIQQIVALSARWPQTTKKLIEAKADGHAVLQSLGRRVHGLEPVDARGPKTERLQATLPLWEGRLVSIPEPGAAPWVESYVHELLSFPAGAYDDQVDATVQALRWFDQHAVLAGPVHQPAAQSRSVQQSRSVPAAPRGRWGGV